MATIEIVHRDTGEVVESMDVSDQTERKIDRIVSGILINLDHENYYTRLVD